MGTVPPINGHAPIPGDINPPCCVPDCGLPAEDELPLDPPVPLCASCMAAIYTHIVDATLPGIAVWAKRMTTNPERPPSPFTLPGHVYFIRMGDRMKIGWSSQWRQRLTNLPHEELLLIVEGTVDAERAQHVRFAEHRIKGEWFAWNDETRALVEKLARWQAAQDSESVGSLIPR